MEKRKETTQKMEAVAKKLIRYSFLEGVEKWPPECLCNYHNKKNKLAILRIGKFRDCHRYLPCV